jgi:predicted methyltransferase
MSRISKATAWTAAVLMIGTALGPLAKAQDSQQARMHAALMAPERSQEDKMRDDARKPVQVIQFLGIKTGMTVLDVIAAGGWYTEVLSAAVGPSGKVLSQNPSFFVNREGFMDAEKALMDRLGNVEPVHGDIADAGIEGCCDAAITALNLHDIYNGQGEDAAVALLKSVYGALKPGGVFGVIDHVGLPGKDNEKLHRIPVDTARDLVTKAGFVIEEESNLLANPNDNHMLPNRDPSLHRNTDRFLFRARKPD